ncbi:MAG: bifunctional 4-hydroxy-2-oxoglutarate aldolase/2-dehydro-3-deoxy-phosphogluconate aldolase [Candidatus Pacebacteria bacterium]|nr:bifunctional 4-hydroxy-2-oxoglutarate aldolase/2-dehydro-3-deoxy-phosphogluconate aldolase [Candidatus Paceibacterota bacterium]
MTKAAIPTLERFKGKIIPVLRTKTSQGAAEIVEILVEQGLDCFELTLSIPDCLTLVERLVARHPRVCFGVGTVLDEVDAARVIDVGASFVVAPAVLPEVAKVCWKFNVACFLGAATPTEIITAHRLGVAGVKLFPASHLGGVGFLKAVKAIYPNIPIMPTGGISPDQASDYFAAGAFAIGMGGVFSQEPVDRSQLITAAKGIMGGK